MTRTPHPLLNPRTVPIIAGLARGRSNTQIATDLGLATSTVKSRLHRTYTATGARGAAHLVALAYNTGVLAHLAPQPDPGTGLTPRQQATLALLATGHTCHQIATRQALSPDTVKTSLHRIYRNLGVTTRIPTRSAAQAIALGYQHGHLPLPTPAAAP